MKSNYIGGEWVAGHAPLSNVNPSDTRDIIDTYSLVTPAQVTDAVSAASEALGAWAACGMQGRADILDIVGREILARKDELADLLAREEGKPLAEAKGEVERAGRIFGYFAGEALRAGDQALASTRPGINVEVIREPVGVVALITPWNFPIAIPAWKIAPALAFGNTVVFKPSENVPASAWALTEILSRAGLPSGAFNLVMGNGADAGAPLVSDERINAVSFTGSAATGRLIARSCIDRDGAIPRFQLEMGGKNPLVVLDDANLETAVECAINGAYYSAGQRCTASSRLIVTDAVHDRFVNAMRTRLGSLKLGDARAAGTIIGPVVDQGQLDKDLEYIAIGRSEGATLAFGGDASDTIDGQPGFYLRPALFTDTTPSMRINREEIFGPVANVLRVSDADEALAVANDTEFGLSAGVVTDSLTQATRFKRELAAGMVMINAPTAGVDYHVPFGGRKASSYGSREQGRHAIEFYTGVKTAYIAC